MEQSEKGQKLGALLVDVLTESPLQFTIKDRTFNIYPKSLAIRMLIDNLKGQLDIIQDNIMVNPILECIRVCKMKQDVVLRMLAYSTIRRKTQIQNAIVVNGIMSYFKDNMEIGDMATLLLHIIKDESSVIERFVKGYGLDKDLERKRKIIETKTKNDNNFSYGGNMVYGSLISFFAEKFGWTFDYILWDISYVNLMMLYIDQSDNIYLSDDEKKKLPNDILSDTRDFLDASNPENAQKIFSALSSRGLIVNEGNNNQ